MLGRISASALLVTVLAAQFTTAGAQEREWIKWHQTVENDEHVFAAFTYIATSDDLSPALRRVLYRDVNDVLLVLRSSVETVPETGAVISAVYSITSPSSGENLTITHHGPGASPALTLAIGSAFLDFGDDIPVGASTKSAAESLLTANSSQGFRDALHELTRNGMRYSNQLGTEARLLHELVFDELSGPRTNLDGDFTEVVQDFDPQAVEPGAFEALFAAAYYEE